MTIKLTSSMLRRIIREEVEAASRSVTLHEKVTTRNPGVLNKPYKL